MKFRKLFFLIPLIGLAGCEKNTETVYEPVRFVVCSDSHVSSLYDENQLPVKRLREMYQYSFEYAKTQEYKKIDHVFVCGDGVDDASIESQTLFNDTIKHLSKQYNIETTTILGNHELTSLDLKSYEEIVADYKSVTGATDLDFHIVLGGFHFIGLSPRNVNWEYVESESAPWLEEQLKIASADDPSGSKPIFVFQHIGIKDTCYGTDIDYQTYTDSLGFEHEAVLIPELLEKYPQVIHFSSHSHRNINDPRMIMQDKYTTITTGSLSYHENDIVNLYPNHVFANPDGTFTWSLFNDLFDLDASQFLIVEVSKDGTTKVMPYSIDGNQFIGEGYTISPFSSTSKFKYTIKRKNASPTPEFGVNNLKASTIGRFDASFDVYQVEGAQNYKCELYYENELVSTEYRIANLQMPIQPETFNISFSLLSPDTAYTLKIYAVSSWGKESSEPLVLNFNTLSVLEGEI